MNNNSITKPLNKLIQNNEYQKAINLCNDILDRQKNNIGILKILGLAYLYNKNFKLAINTYKHLLTLERNDHDIFNNLGICFKNLNCFEEAIEYFKKAIDLKPSYVEAINNLGFTQFKIGQIEESKSNLHLAVKLEPSYLDTYINLGILHYNLGELEQSEKIFNKGLLLKPESSFILNFLGIINLESSNFEKSLDFFWRSFLANTNNSSAINNLFNLLTYYTPEKNKNLITIANHHIRSISNPYINKKMDDTSIINFFDSSIEIINSFNLRLTTDYHEIYRRNSTDMNCSRHMKIFNEKNIIPNYCFGCFKVQIEPNNIIDLIKLFLFIDNLELENNNHTKCFVEMRPNIKGFYKGLIYCSSFDEANIILSKIKNKCILMISKDLKFNIKRGCSEYGLTHVNFNIVDPNDNDFMNYNFNWYEEEKNFDLKNVMRPKKYTSTLKGVNLSDILVIQKWLDYGRAIGDPKVSLFKNNKLIYEKFVIKAQERI